MVSAGTAYTVVSFSLELGYRIPVPASSAPASITSLQRGFGVVRRLVRKRVGRWREGLHDALHETSSQSAAAGRLVDEFRSLFA